jgi:UBX domain-containing protein 6
MKIESFPCFHLQTLKDALFSAEPIQAKLDRGLKVLLPSQANTHTELPPDFFTLTAEELAREQRGR